MCPVPSLSGSPAVRPLKREPACLCLAHGRVSASVPEARTLSSWQLGIHSPPWTGSNQPADNQQPQNMAAIQER